jgi:hypothetical protein
VVYFSSADNLVASQESDRWKPALPFLTFVTQEPRKSVRTDLSPLTVCTDFLNMLRLNELEFAWSPLGPAGASIHQPVVLLEMHPRIYDGNSKKEVAGKGQMNSLPRKGKATGTA